MNILLSILLIVLAAADCPINLYPRKSFSGSLEARLNNDANLHGSPQEYIGSLNDDLQDGGVNVAIGVLGLQFNSHGIVDFTINFMPETVSRTLKFRIIVTDSSYGWKSLKFNYFATQSPLFFVLTESIVAFSGPSTDGKYSTYRPLPESSYTFDAADAFVRVFVNGLKIKAKALSSQYATVVSQYQNFKKFSVNPTLINYFSQAVEDKKALYFEIKSSKMIGKKVAIQFESNCDVTMVKLSYLIINQRTFNEKNSFITGTFALLGDGQYKFTPLQNMDMTLVGLNTFKAPRDRLLSLSLNFNNFLGQASFNLASNTPYFTASYTFVAMEFKLQYICEDCPNSPAIYEGKMCVEKCPRGFSETKRLLNIYCDVCSMDKLKVVDPVTSSCVCASRHFLDSAQDTCKPCRYDCMTCSSADQCLTCDNNLMQTKRKLSSAGKCDCPATGFYDDKLAENIVCQKCSVKCLTCDGPRDFDCRTCSASRELDSKGFCVCKNGYIEDNLGNCICPQPRQLTNGVCLDNGTTVCGPNQTEQFVSLVKKCVCKSGFQQVLNDCIKCGANSTFNADDLTCKCVNNTVKVNNTCVPCPVNTVLDSLTGICVCQPGSFKADDGSCVTCPLKMAYINGNCECIFNFFEAQPNVCQRCLRETDGPKCYRNVH